MKRKPSILDQILAEPVFFGGVVWSHSFLLCRLQEQGISVAIQNFAIVNGTRPALVESAPDSRSMSHQQQLDLYEAMGTGDMKTVTRIWNLMPIRAEIAA